MAIGEICPPALIYLVFSITQISIDTFQGQYNTAFAKILVSLIFTILLNYLCNRGLGIISWFMVFLPFMLMTLIIGLLLYFFGLSPSTGRLNINSPEATMPPPIVDYRKLSAECEQLRRQTDASNLAGNLEGDASNLAGGIDSRVKNLGDSIESDLGMRNSDYYNQRDQGATNNFARGNDDDRDSSDATSGNSAPSRSNGTSYKNGAPPKVSSSSKSSSSSSNGSSKRSEGFFWNF